LLLLSPSVMCLVPTGCAIVGSCVVVVVADLVDVCDPCAWLFDSSTATPVCWIRGCAVVLQIESACVLIWFRLCYGVEWCAMASFVLVGSWLFGTALVWVRELLAVDLCYDKLF
jgi:hypothetical protein